MNPTNPIPIDCVAVIGLGYISGGEFDFLGSLEEIYR
jgi:hypothetical protein